MPNSYKPPKKTRWLRFNLYWLLVAPLVVAAYCGGYVQRNGEVDELMKRQQELAERKDNVDELKKRLQELAERNDELESFVSSQGVRQAYYNAWIKGYKTMLRQEGFDVRMVGTIGLETFEANGLEPGFEVHSPRSGRIWYVNTSDGALMFEEIPRDSK